METMPYISPKQFTKPHQPSNTGEVGTALDALLQTLILKHNLLGDVTKGLPTTSLTHSAAESFLRDALLNKQLRIEIWASKKGTGQWSVIRKVSIEI